MLDRLQGNEALKAELTAAVQNRRLPHSLLLVGEKGCGVGFAARCLAADHLFPNGGPAALDTVEGRVSEISGDGSTVTGKVREVLSVRPSGKGGMIRVDQIRTARSEIFRSSLSTEGRVVMVFDAQCMNLNAANAFLKVLEEPPEGALFLLTASGQAAVLPTIRSRCSIYSVSPVSVQECAAYLRSHDPLLPAGEAERLAAVYGGRIGSCLDARRPGRREGLERARRLFRAAAQQDEYTALVELAPFDRDKAAALQLLRDLSALCAAALRDPAFAAAEAGTFPPARAARAIELCGEAAGKLNANVNPRLVLTLLGAELCARS